MENIKNNRIAASLKPTTENVNREFITGTMKDLLFSNKVTNFNFIFQQKEGIDYIENILKEYSRKNKFFRKDAIEIIERLRLGNEVDNDLPSLIIKDYIRFFEAIRQFYETHIKLFYKRIGPEAGFPVYEMKNCFEQIWLRATPDDFNNPEDFLEKFVQIINDDTFQKYDEDKVIGKSKILGDNYICVKNAVARTWDETPREFIPTIYDKDDFFSDRKLRYKKQFNLPSIRYGIYNKNGKKTCLIGSVQTKPNYFESEKNNVQKIFDRKRFKVNKDIEDTNQVEPSHLISLSIFIDILNKEGITDIVIPSIYVLDYQYHEKRNILIKQEFEEYWNEYRISSSPERYEKEKKQMEKGLNKEEIISKNKTEGLINTILRLIQHYNKTEIKSYPGDGDSNFHIYIPEIKSIKDINNELLIELYEIVNNLYIDKER